MKKFPYYKQIKHLDNNDHKNYNQDVQKTSHSKSKDIKNMMENWSAGKNIGKQECSAENKVHKLW